jgi:DNA polymerase
MSNHKSAKMNKLADRVRNLTASPLYDYRRENDYSPVMGEGSLQAQIMFIGEAPGKKEAQSGRPFVGAAGRVLDELFDSIGLERDDVYITNIVKDRPPDNRDPTQEEIELYSPILDEQIAIIQPAAIVTLGRFAMEFILDRFDQAEPNQKISDLHGQIFAAQAGYGDVAIVPLYHPAVALYNTNQKDTLKEDFQVLTRFI